MAPPKILLRLVISSSTPALSSLRQDGIRGLRQRLESAVTELVLNGPAVEKLPEVKTRELAVPRIAIVHTWTNTQNEGWYRIEFDKLRFLIRIFPIT